MMATLAELEQALIQADEAGNVADATALANEIRKIKNENAALQQLETGIQAEKTLLMFCVVLLRVGFVV